MKVIVTIKADADDGETIRKIAAALAAMGAAETDAVSCTERRRMTWRKPPRGPLTENFTWQEAACNCCGRIPDPEVVREHAERLEGVRDALGGYPMHVHSWSRCPAHNKRVGGAKGSLHLQGAATDFTLRLFTPAQVQANLHAHDGGLGSYPGFTHVDFGPRRRWEDD